MESVVLWFYFVVLIKAVNDEAQETSRDRPWTSRKKRTKLIIYGVENTKLLDEKNVNVEKKNKKIH